MNPGIAKGAVYILLVEDNPGDVVLTREALAYLRREDGYADAVRPDLVLLDLNLPKKDGREVLAEVKQDPDLRRIPVVVLTTSKDEDDILRSYNLRANCYVTKPVDFNQFLTIVKTIEDFWLTRVKLPAG